MIRKHPEGVGVGSAGLLGTASSSPVSCSQPGCSKILENSFQYKETGYSH